MKNQSFYIYGRKPVEEQLLHDHENILRIFISDRVASGDEEVSQIKSFSKTKRIPFNTVSHKKILSHVGEVTDQGVIALLRKPNYNTISYCVRQSLAAGLETTCFEGILRLLPSHNLTVTADGIEKNVYWDYPKTVDPSIDHQQAEEEIARLLDDAVRIRMRSDVSIGLTLSSGLDSTGIAHMMRANSD